MMFKMHLPSFGRVKKKLPLYKTYQHEKPGGAVVEVIFYTYIIFNIHIYFFIKINDDLKLEYN